MRFDLTKEEQDILRKEGVQYDFEKEYYGFSSGEVLDAAFQAEGFLSDELSFSEENRKRISRLASVVDKMQEQIERDFISINESILNYYYSCLKKGEKPKQKDLLPGGIVFWDKDEEYWRTILEALVKNKMLRGDIKELKNINYVEELRITPLGIEYLTTKNPDLLTFE